MSKARWSPKDFKDNGLIEVNGVYMKASTQIANGKVDKLSLMGTGCVHLDAAILVPPMSKALLSYGIEKPKENRKIKNAVKSVVDGVSFDSNLEKYMYDRLIASQIRFEFQKVYLLQEKFTYGTEKIRAITKVVDFWLPTRNIIIDTKGYASDVSPIKHKMLKRALKIEYGIEPEILIPSNRKECDLIINRLLYQP